MDRHATALEPTRIELEARRMYRRMLSQWAGDYLVCRSLMSDQRGPRWTPRRSWHDPPVAELMED